MKAVMYHYVRSHDPRFPYFKNLHIDDFKRQLDFFSSEYGFVSFDDFKLSLTTGIVPKGVLLTFDDGLKDHFDFVLPVLLERKLWGIFYIPTFIYTRRKLLDVHRVHLLLGRYPGKLVYDKLLQLIDDSMLTHGHVSEFKELTYSGQVNDDYTRLIKRTLNYYIGYAHREEVMTALMKYLFPDEESVFESFYLSTDEIRTLHASGMVIGSHTVNHPVMSKLNEEEQRKEIEESFGFLEQTTGGFSIKTFCYPYGGFHSFTDKTENILSENHCAFSFNVESRDVESGDLLLRPQALPRYDCNELPFGQCREIHPANMLDKAMQ